MQNIQNLITSTIISNMGLSNLLVGSIGAVVVFWIGFLLIFSVPKMYKEMNKKIGAKAVTMYRFEISDNGNSLEFLMNNESFLDGLKGNGGKKVFENNGIFNFDMDLLREFNQITEPYRKKYLFFKYFLPIKVEEDSALISFTNRLKNELRKVTRQQFERMTEEEKNILSFKFAIWVACTDVIELSKKSDTLRNLREYDTKGNFDFDDGHTLEKSSDSPGTKQWLEELRKKLITTQFGLLTSFLLESYFQVKIIKMNKTTDGKGVYIYIPVQFDEKKILTIFLPSSAVVNSNYREKKILLMKIVIRYQKWYKLARILGFVIKKGLVRFARILLR